MFEGEHTLLYKLILLLAIVIVAYFFISIAFGFDLMKFLSQPPGKVSDISQPQEVNSVQYQGFELNHNGMILRRDSGETDINSILGEKPIVPGCSGCSGCSPIYFHNQPSPPDAYKCSSCGTCNGITQTSPQNRFIDCYDCNTASGNCSICTDDYDEYNICKRIKDYCLTNYDKDNGCVIKQIPHTDNTVFDLNNFLNILSHCKSESLIVDMGNNISKELCYFNSSSISSYNFDRTSNDFYVSYQTDRSNIYLPTTDSNYYAYAYTYNLKLTPFYKENGQTLDKYKVYVAINGTPYKDFNIKLENTTPSGPLGRDPVVGDNCNVGKITTDSTGFGYAFFSPSDCQSSNIDDWKNKPDEHPISGAEAYGPDKLDAIYAVFYANMPASNGDWSNDLRYSNCNFQTSLEPYLKNRPWWAYNSDNLNSSWIINGNPNSSIKVFSDSNMPGGGSNNNRGNIQIRLGNFDPNFLRNCKFDIYVCAQDAFAEYENEGILGLSDFLTNFAPANVHKIIKNESNQIILYNYFEYDLDKNYTIDEIKSAIKTGFRLWEQNTFLYSSFSSYAWLTYNDGIKQSAWNELNGGVEYSEDCWNKNIENDIFSISRNNLIGNCPGSICSGKIKFRVAFKYIKPSSTTPYPSPLYPTITFCGYSLTPTPACRPTDECHNPQLFSGECGGVECKSDCTCTNEYMFYPPSSGCQAAKSIAIDNEPGVYFNSEVRGTCGANPCFGHFSDVTISTSDDGNGCVAGYYFDGSYPNRWVSAALVSVPGFGSSPGIHSYIWDSNGTWISMGDYSNNIECAHPYNFGGTTWACYGHTCIKYGLVNSANYYGWAFLTPADEDLYFKNLKRAWCGDANKDCLLCESNGGNGYGGDVTTNWYVCNANTHPSSFDSSSYGVQVVGTGVTISSYDFLTNTLLSSYTCQADGNWA
jgi:hypothetical protein